MVLINSHYQKLKAGYLFPEIARRVAKFQEANPGAGIIRLGIGDVVEPLPPAVIAALHAAVDEMAGRETFHGYGPEQGYPFLRAAIIEHEYAARGIAVALDEVFVSDGSKCDTGNIGEIFGQDCVVAVTDPVYPVYVDTAVMAGRKIVYLPATEKNNFLPDLPQERVDLIYLCSPNNPTGAVMRRENLKRWVDYARKNAAVIFFDSAYAAFINDKNLPHSIYEIPGADEVAIEFRSFSKNAGFTGTRCAFTVVPQKLVGLDAQGRKAALNPLWHRRQTTKFNGVPYIVQKGAAACYTPEGREQIKKLVAGTLENARLIREGLQKTGIEVFGGINAPYIWMKTPGGSDSWDFFDKLLQESHVVGTPGSGFGPAGSGYFRLSAFGRRDQISAAIARIQGKLHI